MRNPTTLTAAIRHFATWENCREYLVTRRWPDGVTCPTCGSKTVYFDSSRPGWECKTRHPKRKFTLKTGTVFEDSALGLDKWLPVVWMIANMRNGVSSHEIARSIGVTQKTAWFMLQRIRLAMQDDSPTDKFSGHIEADETFVGGKARNMHPGRKARTLKGRESGTFGKAIVMGVLERNSPDRPSRVRTTVVKTTRRHAVIGEIRRNVDMDGTSTVYTDALKSYERPATWTPRDNYAHKVIDHAEAYVNGAIHTNGMENYWSLLKRTLKGTYVSVEPFHLFRYLDEQAFRFNLRKNANDADRFSSAIRGIIGKRLTYDALTGRDGLQATY
jgi:transposase-like protein